VDNLLFKNARDVTIITGTQVLAGPPPRALSPSALAKSNLFREFSLRNSKVSQC
jgi:hypothetical protein